MFCEPLRGWRHVRVTERRTKVDWAHTLRDFLNEFYAEAEKIVLVMDNLNTRSPGSFYEAFGPEEARRLTERLVREIGSFVSNSANTHTKMNLRVEPPN